MAFAVAVSRAGVTEHSRPAAHAVVKVEGVGAGDLSTEIVDKLVGKRCMAHTGGLMSAVVSEGAVNVAASGAWFACFRAGRGQFTPVGKDQGNDVAGVDDPLQGLCDDSQSPRGMDERLPKRVRSKSNVSGAL